MPPGERLGGHPSRRHCGDYVLEILSSGIAAKVFSNSGLTPEELVLVEPLSVGYHAANRGRVAETDTVLVIGCGTIGLGVIAAATRKGATVIATDVEDSKLAIARKYGAQHTINSSQNDVVAGVRHLTQGEGASVAIEAVGLPETFRLAVEAVAFAGRVVYIGYAKQDVTYNTTDFVRKKLDILGSRNALRIFPSVIKMLAQHDKPVSELISPVYPFQEAPRAFSDWEAAPSHFTKILIDLKA
jgi:threonine dehydrogenase-like Zn-dependent dehydrogenase